MADREIVLKVTRRIVEEVNVKVRIDEDYLKREGLSLKQVLGYVESYCHHGFSQLHWEDVDEPEVDAEEIDPEGARGVQHVGDIETIVNEQDPFMRRD